jgi:putative ATPase
LATGTRSVTISSEALESISQLAGGDARKALNLLEQVAIDGVAAGLAEIEASTVERLAQRKVLLYDKSGEEHFNHISAFHKALRDSDVDGALYWLTRMLEAGEDPHYIARRMVRFASEDIGLADPRALRRALDAWDAYDRLGPPEGDLALVQGALYLALAPKSNATYKAHGAARRTVAERPADPVPMAIRNAPTRLMKGVGYGKGYVYAHDTEEGTGGLDCLPEALQGTVFYHPTERGVEARYRERTEQLRGQRQRAQKRRSEV